MVLSEGFGAGSRRDKRMPRRRKTRGANASANPNSVNAVEGPQVSDDIGNVKAPPQGKERAKKSRKSADGNAVDANKKSTKGGNKDPYADEIAKYMDDN